MARKEELEKVVVNGCSNMSDLGKIIYAVGLNGVKKIQYLEKNGLKPACRIVMHNGTKKTVSNIVEMAYA